MEGNFSDNEEEELIDSLKSEIPKVQKSIDASLQSVDQIDQMIIQLQKNKEIADLQPIKDEKNQL